MTSVVMGHEPIITTCRDTQPPVWLDMAGACFFEGCLCPSHVGKHSNCSRCNHSNEYHTAHTKRNSEWMELKRAWDIDQAQKRAQLEAELAAREEEDAIYNPVSPRARSKPQSPLGSSQAPQFPTASSIPVAESPEVSLDLSVPQLSPLTSPLASASSAPAAKSPCDVEGCDCKKCVVPMHSLPVMHSFKMNRFEMPASSLLSPMSPSNTDTSIPMPRLCRRCKHAELYHTGNKESKSKPNKDEKKGKEKKK